MAGEAVVRWKRVAAVKEAVRVFPSSVDPDTVYAWTRSGLVVSKDAGRSFSERPAAVAQLGTLTALMVNPARPAMLYAGTDAKGLFASDDEGATWRPLGGTDQGLAHPHIHALTLSPFDPSFSTLFATHSLRHPGISMTMDGGTTWRAFARDFGAGDLILLGTHILFAGAHPAGGAQTGFYRSLDGGSRWFRVLNVENPTALVASPVRARRAWFGTANAGLFVTDDSGVSSRAVGPQTGVNVASLAVGFASPEAERVHLYDPTGEGVLASDDGFATWRKANDGLYVGSWVAEGAMMAASADGSTLFACVNGALYRAGKAPSSSTPLGLSALRAQPAAVPAGEGTTTVTCRAAKDCEVHIDLSPLGGAPDDVPMLDDGKSGDGAANDGVFGIRFDVPENALTPPKDEPALPLPGPMAFAVRATRGQDTETGHAILFVTPNPRDRVLWNGEEQNTHFIWTQGGVSIGRSQEQPLSGSAHVRIEVTAPGQGGFSWRPGNGWWNGDDTRAHQFLCFHLRSNREGPSDLVLSLRDDGRRFGHAEGGRANDLPLARYLPRVTTQYQLVAIPLADFIFGSAAVPEGICELMFIAGAPRAGERPGEPRIYDVDDIGLAVRGGPRLAEGQGAVLPDGKSVRLAVRATPMSGKLSRVTAAANARTFALHDDGQHDDGEAGDGCFAAVVPAAELGTGLRTIQFTAQDAAGTREAKIAAFLPRRAPGRIALARGPVKCDGDLSEFEGAEPFVLAQGPHALTARILHGERNLYFALEVKDPAFTAAKPPRDHKPDALAALPSVEVVLTSPTTAVTTPRTEPSPEDHRIVFAAFDKRAWAVLGTHRWDAATVRTAGGYTIEAQVPFDALRGPRQHCDFAIGKATRIELRLNAADGAKLAWAAPSPKESENPENWGLASFTHEAGPPRLTYERADGSVLSLASNKPLHLKLARNAASYEIPGSRLTKAEATGDGRTIRLTAAEPWKVGQRLTVRFPGLTCADGLAPRGSLEFTVLPGRTVTGDPLLEFLIGEVRQGVNPKTVFPQEFLDKSVRPSAGPTWRVARSEDGRFDLRSLVGRFGNALAHAHAYVYSDAERAIELSVSSDDGAQVTVNGTVVHTSPTARTEKIKGVRLNKGWNSLLLAVSQAGGDWNFSVRITDDEGKEPVGLSYQAERPAGLERESVERKAQGGKDAPRSTLHASPPDAPRSTPGADRVPEASTADVTVERVSFFGWPGSWRIRNRACELFVVPQIGRVMHFSPLGGGSVLWVDFGLTGQTVPRDDKQWHNFGGDKVWPTAQGLWEKYTGRKGWPPPYHFDCAPATVEPIPGGVRLTTPIDPHFGARCVREFTMDPQRPLVRVRQRFEKPEGKPAEMTIWSVCQVTRPLFALLPVGEESEGRRYIRLGDLSPDCIRTHPSAVSLRNDEKLGQKIGVRPDAGHRSGWVAAVYDKLLFVQSHRLERAAAYPDNGCHGELFAAPQAMGSYVELELLSPLRELRAGDTLRDDAVWQLVPLTEAQSSDPERAAAVAREAHNAALDVLARRE